MKSGGEQDFHMTIPIKTGGGQDFHMSIPTKASGGQDVHMADGRRGMQGHPFTTTALEVEPHSAARRQALAFP